MKPSTLESIFFEWCFRHPEIADRLKEWTIARDPQTFLELSHNKIPLKLSLILIDSEPVRLCLYPLLHRSALELFCSLAHHSLQPPSLNDKKIGELRFTRVQLELPKI